MVKCLRPRRMHILRCMGSKFCVKFQRAPLKFHTKFWTHTPQNVHFTVFYFCLWVTISSNCDVISLSQMAPRSHGQLLSHISSGSSMRGLRCRPCGMGSKGCQKYVDQILWPEYREWPIWDDDLFWCPLSCHQWWQIGGWWIWSELFIMIHNAIDN